MRARTGKARAGRRTIPGTTADHVWLDGRIVPATQARVSVFDRAFLYGDAFFETLRVYDGRLFLAAGHLRRLRASLRRFGIAPPRLDLERAAGELLAACRLRDAAIRLTVTRGVAEGLVPPPGLAPTVVLTARQVPSSLPAERERGIAAIRLSFGHGRGGAGSGHKNVDYLAAVAGRTLAARRRASEALFVESDGFVSEGTTSNLFVVRRGRVYTPPVEAGCLPGLTRERVVVIARRAGIEIHEQAIRASRLDDADEIFLTGTVIEVLPVCRLDGRPVGAGRPGPVTRRMQVLYRGMIARRLARTARLALPTRAEDGRNGARPQVPRR